LDGRAEHAIGTHAGQRALKADHAVLTRAYVVALASAIIGYRVRIARHMSAWAQLGALSVRQLMWESLDIAALVRPLFGVSHRHAPNSHPTRTQLADRKQRPRPGR